MKSTRIWTFVFIVYFFCLFFNNISQIKAAEAPDDNSSDDLNTEYVAQIPDDTPIHALVDSLVETYYERNLFVEFILLELSIYVSLLLKLFALVNPADLEEKCLPLKQFFVSFLLDSTFERRENVVSKNKSETLKQFLDGNCANLRNKLSQQMHENSVKLFDTVLTHKDQIQGIIDSLLNILFVLYGYGIERFLASAAFTLFSFFDEHSFVLDDFVGIFSSSPRKEISSRFISNKDIISWVDFDFCYNRVNLGSLKEKAESSAQRQFTNQIIDGSNLDIEELCKIKEILLTALDLLKTALYIVFMFERRSFFRFLSQIRDVESKIKEELDKISCDRLSEQKYLELKVSVRNLFDIGGVQSNNLVGECYEECLTKEILTNTMTSVYKSLLGAILLLKKFETTFLGVDFFKLLFENILALFEGYTKECAQQIKKIKSLTEKQVESLQMSTMRQKYRAEKELHKQLLVAQAEIKKKENKERKLREKNLKEEKERLERERLREANKNKEKKPQRKKPRSRREYPVVEGNMVETSNEDIREAQKSASSDASQEVSSGDKQQACRPKVNRKEEKLKKLLKEEQKSLQREEVKKTILEQKYSNISTKRRKQGERRIKNESRREKEERERLEEKEREKKKREKMEHSDYMYALLNSISSIEGLFAEVEKSKAGISGLISSVFQIISEDTTETEGASAEEGISAMFASLSVSDTVTPQQQASGLSRTGLELGARPKTRVGCPKPRSRSSSSSSSSSSSKSSARRRSRSRSRSRRSSRSRARSSRSRGRSRSRNRSSEMRTLTFDGFEIPDSIFSSTVQDDPNKGSKFLKYFQDVDSELGKQNSNLFEEKYLEYEQKLIDLSVITQDSLEDEILSALEQCGSLIQTLHTVIIPVVLGKELMYLRLLERSFVRYFIKFLIFLQQKKNE